MAENDDEVGYGKPPKHARFKKGQSGNPKGRPKRSGTILDSHRKHMRGSISVIEDGKPKRMARPDAVHLRILNKALSGDVRSIDLLYKMDQSCAMQDVPTVDQAADEELDLEQIRKFLESRDRTAPKAKSVPQPYKPDNVID